MTDTNQLPPGIGIECAPRLEPLITTPKPIKIIVGGRGSTKSTFAGDYVLSDIRLGKIWCCGREFLDSIEESVHRLMLDEIDRLGLPGFTHDKSHIYHRESGGRNFYKGLRTNPKSLKSMLSGVAGIWIEEGDTLSKATLDVLTASLRVSAKDSQKLIEGDDDIRMPECWITMNRGSSTDPISKKWLKRADKELARCGYYEDEHIMVVQINWTDIPRKWWLASGLESERADDEENMSTAEYDHKWGGAYADTVENAIISPEWFDACIDAHEKLNFPVRGVEVVSHDPSDLGSDPKGLAYRKGVVFLDVQEIDKGDVNDGADWAIEYCEEKKPDAFIWDGGGMGVTLRRDFNNALGPKNIQVQMFDGASGVDRPEQIYEDGRDKKEFKKTNKQTFKNKRAQYYWDLRDRCYRTYLAVVKGEYHDPDTLISFSSDIKDLDILRAEICKIPRKYNPIVIQIMNKKEMRDQDIESPNMADSVMMNLSYDPPKITVSRLRPVKRRRFGA